MKKKLQQWAALCLTLALAFCLALPVWADEPTTYDIVADQKGTIQVTGIEKPADTTVTVNVYQLMDVHFDTVNQQPEEPVYTWVDAVATWLENNTNETYKEYIKASDNSVTEAFSAPTNDADGTKAAKIAAFYDALAAAIRSTPSPLIETPTKSVQATNGSCTISDLEMGNYLVLIEGGMKVYRPSAVNLVPEWDDGTKAWNMSTPVVELKAREPALTKTVSDTQVAIGDTVTYTLVADLPYYPENALHKNYQISDVLPAGMTLTSTSVKVYAGDEHSQTTELNDTTGYTLTSSDAQRPTDVTTDEDVTAASFAVTFQDITALAERGYTKIKVTYTATANGSITVRGNNTDPFTVNTNTAYLDYNNDPYGLATSWQTKKATATVYSYGIKVNKVDENNIPLSGAKFTLSKNSDGSAPIHFEGSNGTYLKTASGDTEIEVDSSGKLTLSGLDVGTYYLTETKAPGGYVKLDTPQTIVITDNKTGAEGTQDSPKPNGLLEDNSTGTDGADGYYELDVVNSKGFTLPSTGGMGTVLFTAIGIVLMGGGLVLLLLYLRRRNRAE